MSLERELQNIINQYAREETSYTPDFILARFMMECLDAFEQSTIERDAYWKKEEVPEGFESRPRLRVRNYTPPDPQVAEVKPENAKPGSERAYVIDDHDPVDHPPHYGGDTPYETIKVIEAWLGLAFHLGSAIKYISRMDDKDSWELNLEKALWYLRRYRTVRRQMEEDDPPLQRVIR